MGFQSKYCEIVFSALKDASYIKYSNKHKCNLMCFDYFGFSYSLNIHTIHEILDNPYLNTRLVDELYKCCKHVYGVSDMEFDYVYTLYKSWVKDTASTHIVKSLKDI